MNNNKKNTKIQKYKKYQKNNEMEAKTGPKDFLGRNSIANLKRVSRQKNDCCPTEILVEKIPILLLKQPTNGYNW